jgi:hypothetical protein
VGPGYAALSVCLCTPLAAHGPEPPGAGPPWWRCPGWHSRAHKDAWQSGGAPAGRQVKARDMWVQPAPQKAFPSLPLCSNILSTSAGKGAHAYTHTSLPLSSPSMPSFSLLAARAVNPSLILRPTFTYYLMLQSASLQQNLPGPGPTP